MKADPGRPADCMGCKGYGLQRMMQAKDHQFLADSLLPAVLAAARVQMSYFGTEVAAAIKADNSPVTAADQESEAILLEGLARAAPGVPVVSEEAAAAGHVPAVGATFFLVDPLDGTKPFLRHEPHFTINIALIEDRTPTFGLLYAPALDDLYVTVGQGQACAARLAPASEARTLAACALEPLHARVPDPNAISALVSQSHLDTTTERFLEHYSVLERRALSSSLKFGLLARGEADVYPRAGPTSEWDTAAGHAVLAAAGGAVTTFDGEPLLYGKPRFRNPGFVAWGRGPLPPVRPA
jgi:3'(2'), 5'-bisphosphate nucleotidase